MKIRWGILGSRERRMDSYRYIVALLLDYQVTWEHLPPYLTRLGVSAEYSQKYIADLYNQCDRLHPRIQPIAGQNTQMVAVLMLGGFNT